MICPALCLRACTSLSPFCLFCGCLPAVHFLCGHSYNLRTLGDGDVVCPLCAGEHRKAQELRRSNRASAADKVRTVGGGALQRLR